MLWQQLGRAFGIESEVLSPKETKKLYPLMNVDDVYATLYSPADGTIEPAGYCSALTRAAVKAGARVVEGCSLTAIETVVDDYGTRKVHAVQTNKGRIRTNCVVNCAGRNFRFRLIEPYNVWYTLFIFRRMGSIRWRIS